MKKVKRLLSLSLVAAICLTLIVGCGNTSGSSSGQTPASSSSSSSKTGGDSSTAEVNPMPSLENPGTIDVQEFVADPSNGGWAMIAAAIADKANAYFNNFPITATTGGAVANPPVMVSGDAQIGLTQGLFLNKLLAGEAPYDAPSDELRAIASLESTCLYFVVDASYPYDTLGELINSGEKIKVGAMVASAASSIAGVMVLQEYGLNSFDELQPNGSDVYVADGTALYEAYGDHHFDMLIVNKSTSDAALKELLNNRSSKILSIEKDVLSSLEEKYGWGEMTIPADTYAGQTEDTVTTGIKSILVVRKDVPDELAYVLAKVCCEEKPYLETVQASYKAFDVADMVQNTVVDFHPGALRYWQEAGLIAK